MTPVLLRCIVARIAKGDKMSSITIDRMQAAINRGTLRLTDQGLTALPTDLSPLAGQLKVLDLSKNALTALPDSLAALTGLRTLILLDNQLTALPDAFAELTELRILDARRNKLRDLPPSLNQCTALTRLQLASNKLKAVPDIMWHVGGLTHFDGMKGYPNGARFRSFEAFYKAVHRVDRPPEVRARVFDLFRGQPDAATPLVELFEALTLPHDAVREAAHAELLRRGGYAARPVAAGDRVVVLGRTHSQRTALKERLQAVDIGYGIKVDARTTHVVVGLNPKKWDGVDRAGLTFCGEHDLIGTLDALDTPYLVEEAAESPDAAADVAEMLASPDRDTVAMGLELVAAGGVPEGVQTALFYVARGLGDKKLGAKARKLLKVHGDPKVQKAVADRSKLFSTGDKAESKTASALNAYRRSAPELDWPRMALWIKRDHGVGLRFAVLAGDDAVRREALRLTIQDGFMDLYTHFSGYMPSFYNHYAYHDSLKMPPDVLSFTEISALSLRGCRFASLPAAIGELQSLRTLDLRGNFFETLPPEMARLTRLETLHLGNNRFDVFPSDVITRLTGLRTLTFVGNRGEDAKTAPKTLSIPDEVKAALPECSFEDGLHAWQASLKEYYWDVS